MPKAEKAQGNAKGKGKNVAARVREAVEAPVREAGFRIWDVTFYKEAAEMILEISVDFAEPGGRAFSTDDCMTVTKIVDPILDELDPLDESYSLVVSGGGCVRDLRLDEHIRFALENRYPVSLRTFTAFDQTPAEDAGEPAPAKGKTGKKGKAGKANASGNKQFEGTIASFDDETLTLDTEAGPLRFDRKQIAKLTAFLDEGILNGDPQGD